jgi:hypothetical protein
MTNPTTSPEDISGSVTVRYLTPENIHIFIGRLGSIHCIIDNQDAFANVHCLLCFPIIHPDRFISIYYTADDGKEWEIGVVENPDIFPAETQKIIHESLKQHYFEQTILRLYEIRWEYGLLFLDVETLAGRKTFSMQWLQGKALEYGKSGKVLIDTFENRFVIPSLKDLPTSDRNRLMRFIYW